MQNQYVSSSPDRLRGGQAGKVGEDCTKGGGRGGGGDCCGLLSPSHYPPIESSDIIFMVVPLSLEAGPL